MPYKFQYEKKKIRKEHDRRVKLTEDDKEKIRKEYATGNISQYALADKYKVSRSLIGIVVNPEREATLKKQFKERRKDGRYYDKDKQREYMKKHRRYKKELQDKDLLD